MPWCANCFDSGVLSHTPGNFLAEKTVKTSLKHDASTGVLPVLTCDGLPLAIWLGGAATLTKENLSLREDVSKPVNCPGHPPRLPGGKRNLPKVALCPHAEVLEHKPDANLVVVVREPECARR